MSWLNFGKERERERGRERGREREKDEVKLYEKKESDVIGFRGRLK